ncbi:glutamate racemase [Candidatus Saccharibacteria bacterium]|nr:glutamate racemase [Candidatus Saccharibacteria bacterium]
MKLGVFDSGIGGEAVAQDLALFFPDARLIVANDSANVPYGSKTPSQVISLTERAIQPLIKSGCDVIVIACNTATALAISHLRSRYPLQKFVGIEPMVKTAALATKTGVIAVCATPATLASNRYEQLKSLYASHLLVVEPDCSNWANLIEHNAMNSQKIAHILDEVLDESADVIVLGCTHYHWIRELIQAYVGDSIKVIEPTEALARQIRSLVTNR